MAFHWKVLIFKAFHSEFRPKLQRVSKIKRFTNSTHDGTELSVSAHFFQNVEERVKQEM